jgi:hypothetical protein
VFCANLSLSDPVCRWVEPNMARSSIFYSVCGTAPNSYPGEGTS